MCMRSATTTRPTRPRRCRLGSPNIRASSCTSHQHRRPGSTWSSGCSPNYTLLQIRRGVFLARDFGELEAAIETRFIQRNAKPKPFKWSAKANIILEKNARARRALKDDRAAGPNSMNESTPASTAPSVASLNSLLSRRHCNAPGRSCAQRLIKSDSGTPTCCVASAMDCRRGGSIDCCASGLSACRIRFRRASAAVHRFQVSILQAEFAAPRCSISR